MLRLLDGRRGPIPSDHQTESIGEPPADSINAPAINAERVRFRRRIKTTTFRL